MLATTRTVIVDEIHAVAGSKRGSHLALSLERLDALAGRRLTRIGLSATQKPIDEVARFLVGVQRHRCRRQRATARIVDSGHMRQRDLAIELPDAPLEAVMSNEVWTQIYDRLAQLMREHRTTLVFVNTRRLAERVARHLSERLDDANRVAAHHGSLAKELRFDAEQRLKRGELKALVATASLELGIDIGDVDLVCQLGSPRSINAFLQRVGRSGHAVGGTPKGRLFPLSRDDLVECTALLDSVRRGELDRLKIPQMPLDVLAQQIVAEVAARDCSENELFELCRSAYPYRAARRASRSTRSCACWPKGSRTRRGRHGALLYHDAVNRMIRGAQGRAADRDHFRRRDSGHRRLPGHARAGRLPGRHGERRLRGREPGGRCLPARQHVVSDPARRAQHVRVEDARGEAPTIPFWLGEAPGRTDELSVAVSRLRDEIEERLGRAATDVRARVAACDDVGVSEAAAAQLVAYLAAAHAALGSLPTQQTIVFERFFDEAGGMQLVIHSPFGSRINRAWGLALRKRFCRTFNFELQAAATEDTIILSLTTAHSFELAEVARYLHPNTRARNPDAGAAGRADVHDALALGCVDRAGAAALPRRQEGAAAARAHECGGPARVGVSRSGGVRREHRRATSSCPIIRWCGRRCATASKRRWTSKASSGCCARSIERRIRVAARDLTEPSPLALEVLSARPYAYLDDAPLEERRTQAVMSRRWMDPESAADIGKLDPEAIARVRERSLAGSGERRRAARCAVWLTFLTERRGRSASRRGRR